MNYPCMPWVLPVVDLTFPAPRRHPILTRVPEDVLPVGVPRVELPTLTQTAGHRHGTRHLPLPILMLQVVGRLQLGTPRHGHPIRTCKAEVKRLHGMPRLAHRILIPAVVLAVRQVDGAARHRNRAGVGEKAAGPGADHHPLGVKPHRAVWFVYFLVDYANFIDYLEYMAECAYTCCLGAYTCCGGPDTGSGSDPCCCSFLAA